MLPPKQPDTLARDTVPSATLPNVLSSFSRQRQWRNTDHNTFIMAYDVDHKDDNTFTVKLCRGPLHEAQTWAVAKSNLSFSKIQALILRIEQRAGSDPNDFDEWLTAEEIAELGPPQPVDLVVDYE
jgi:3-methyladenine DNA glycosylase/8-oxoguanine DNA glycosylase